MSDDPSAARASPDWEAEAPPFCWPPLKEIFACRCSAFPTVAAAESPHRGHPANLSQFAAGNRALQSSKSPPYSSTRSRVPPGQSAHIRTTRRQGSLARSVPRRSQSGSTIKKMAPKVSQWCRQPAPAGEATIQQASRRATPAQRRQSGHHPGQQSRSRHSQPPGHKKGGLAATHANPRASASPKAPTAATCQSPGEPPAGPKKTQTCMSRPPHQNGEMRHPKSRGAKKPWEKWGPRGERGLRGERGCSPTRPPICPPGETAGTAGAAGAAGAAGPRFHTTADPSPPGRALTSSAGISASANALSTSPPSPTRKAAAAHLLPLSQTQPGPPPLTAIGAIPSQQPAAPTPPGGRPTRKSAYCHLNKDKCRNEARCPAEPHGVPTILLAGYLCPIYIYIYTHPHTQQGTSTLYPDSSSFSS
ncbi:hypothetical protein NDU88_002148 [Pleurodeles waltl]|uniref:Uncharacterized protein n=1 Tax=Pleurodeles waltl TaxID=8319 RepID=A0AAV7REM8_PLEWA|nr:hypothetical protein NDU88_002148 [Pleurodeles waltl]